MSSQSQALVHKRVWENVAADRTASWYLDPLVAAQKRSVYLALLEKWTPPDATGVLLKTDLFEEANGDDELLSGCRQFGRVLGIDVSMGQAARARARLNGLENLAILAADVRSLALATGSVDVILSNSTLDHFDTTAELDRALGELSRVLRPGGTAIVTLDNSRNPLYWLLRLAAFTRLTPFPLGVTTSLAGLVRKLEAAGLEVVETESLIHNPRVLSTGIFLLLRKSLGRKADSAVGLLLRTFGWLDRAPTRELTACFVAVRAQKPRHHA